MMRSLLQSNIAMMRSLLLVVAAIALASAQAEEQSDTPSLRPSLSTRPSSDPSDNPSIQPSVQPSLSTQPSFNPSVSMIPSTSPSEEPSSLPSGEPSSEPSLQPSSNPSRSPSEMPSKSSQPSAEPSSQPSEVPSSEPSFQPSSMPSGAPSEVPSISSLPSAEPSSQPSSMPSQRPSEIPSMSSQPSAEPSSQPSAEPSSEPSSIPSSSPSAQPSSQPSSEPSSMPSCTPSAAPTPPETTHLFYPDWSPNGSSCINDGEQPHYMTINTGDYMTSTLESCCTKWFSWNFDECVGSHPDDCTKHLYYPDWHGGSGKCVADGNEPAYMNTNSEFYFFNNLQDCCRAFYLFDFNNCAGVVADDSTDLYYPDWGDSAHVCKADGNQPMYMTQNPSSWMFSTLEKCCKQHYWWNYDECMGNEEPDVVEDAKFYMVWGSTGKCVQDCAVGAGEKCGGRANFWDQLFDSQSQCCSEMNWWNPSCNA